MTLRLLPPSCALLMLLTACQSRPPVSDDIQRALAEAKTLPATTPGPQAALNQALLPPLRRPPPRAVAESRFDLTVKDAAARDFFMGLVEGTRYNMLVHPGVTGTITLNLKNVTVPEVLDAVRSVYGYDYTQRNNIYEVMPGGLTTRFFPIDYLNLKRLGESEIRVNSGQLTDTSGSNNSGSGSNSNNNNTTTSSPGQNQTQTPSTRIQTGSATDLWKELSQSLQAIVGSGAERQVIISPQTGVVVVRALPNELRAVEEFLNRAQLSLQRQVQLEAKIIEVTLNDGYQSGINWAKLGSINGFAFDVGLSGAPLGGTLPSVPLIPGSASAENPLGGVFSGVYGSNDFSGAIELLQSQGKVNVLSSPRVSTVNNQKAVIKVGQDEFFVTNISTTTTSGVGTTGPTTPNVTLTPFFSGIALDVTPQISHAGDITLHIHPSVSDVRAQQKQITVGDNPSSVPLALSSIRESDSIVRARSGQVVVIGGLMQNQSSEDDAGVPGLSKIPLLGHLFKQVKNSSKKSELVILLRPVVVEDSHWQQQLDEARRQFQHLDQTGTGIDW